MQEEASAVDCIMDTTTTRMDTTVTRMGSPMQILGTDDPITGAKIKFDAGTLDILTGVYTDLFTIPVTRTTPSFLNLDACGINPIDLKLYCHIELRYQGASTNFLARVGDTQVHLVYRMDDMDSTDVYSGTVDVDGAYISFLKSPGRCTDLRSNIRAHRCLPLPTIVLASLPACQLASLPRTHLPPPPWALGHHVAPCHLVDL